MRKIFTFLLFPISMALFAQKTGLHKLDKLSISLEGGAVNAFMRIPEIDWLIFDCFPCTIFDETPLPSSTMTLQMAFTLDYRLNAKHQIGLGLLRSQYGEKGTMYGFKKKAVDYWGITARHRFKLLSGQKLDLLLSNTLNLEFPKHTEFYINTHTGLSHTGALVLAFHLSQSFSAELSMLGKTALTQYVDGAWNGKYNRFGYGLLLGANYQL